MIRINEVFYAHHMLYSFLYFNSPLLMSGRDGKKDQSMPPATNMYTLFSQSPWPVGISKVSEGNSEQA